MPFKLIGNKLRTLINEAGNVELIFEIKGDYYKQLAKAIPTSESIIEVREPRSKRTLDQNKMLWGIIKEITDYEQGIGGDEWDTYLTILELGNCKYEYTLMSDEAAESLKEIYRTIKFVGKRLAVDPNTGESDELNMYKCFYGSSKFTTAEMAHLIDTALSYASKIGMNIETM